MKFTLPKNIKKLINKKILLITGAIIILGGLFSIAVVQQVKVNRIEKAVATARLGELRDLQAENAALKKQNAELTSSVQWQTAQTETVCNSYKVLAATYRKPQTPICQK